MCMCMLACTVQLGFGQSPVRTFSNESEGTGATEAQICSWRAGGRAGAVRAGESRREETRAHLHEQHWKCHAEAERHHLRRAPQLRAQPRVHLQRQRRPRTAGRRERESARALDRRAHVPHGALQASDQHAAHCHRECTCTSGLRALQ